jgi:alkanesulfonate monooxygenase SsuD/methylene tetrahydromethanopterin reductase-like flavin-dependent oxidoreductase (luciferase family)
MRLGYFTMPVHPIGRDWSQTLREDREAIVLADRLGFHDAFVGEHLTDACENITNSMLFHATLISDTRQIKLATGTTNLSQIHPVVIAQQAAMFDHLSQGRFIFGVSPGALASDAEVLGILEQDRNKMFAEAIDVILAIWERDPPYDIDFPDNRFKVSTARTQALDRRRIFGSRSKPRPEIGTVVAPFSPGSCDGQARLPSAVGELFAVQPSQIALDQLRQGQGRSRPEGRYRRLAGGAHHLRRRRRQDRVALRPRGQQPHRFYSSRCTALKRATGLTFKNKEQPDAEITHDFVMDHCVIHGGVNKVVDAILKLREQTGDFGELVYAGMDWVDPALAKRSMQLMAEQVMPRVNAAIGKPAASAAE